MTASMNYIDGLQSLRATDFFFVKQHKSLVEALTGYQPASKFSIFNRESQLLFNAYEESTCCQRCWCTNSRELVLHIMDTANNEVIRMTRALKCCCVCCWCGDCNSCKQEMIIESPPGTVIGSVNHEESRCRMRYTLRDANRTNMMGIIGPRCICDGPYSCCCESEFAIIGTDGETKIGAIQKQYGGYCTEAFTSADSFTLEVPMNLDAKMKAVGLGALFLIEFMCFVYKPNNS
ncbi:unnamed protein product [Rotaria magnacalcarata]|uniref:Phospholipid scramblase n=1 Tax=Rotaria magnacalcarata TaxID=392030 RepID=A0A815KC97_9BILA|nr:unnamed protein product [Rotaria magnacalcarata]CAF1389185.1 unnamed protein product [Rotaria magnacalcarata]CAF2035789.1 unnamed protein product [Rotaria magnacalcarata]CAF2119133.1 unnamed protein product [Rotaria magnacalcarata]CAF2129400.1 unnamed protein product [Rotaria magnacalcarata]